MKEITDTVKKAVSLSRKTELSKNPEQRRFMEQPVDLFGESRRGPGVHYRKITTEVARSCGWNVDDVKDCIEKYRKAIDKYHRELGVYTDLFEADSKAGRDTTETQKQINEAKAGIEYAAKRLQEYSEVLQSMEKYRSLK